MQNLFNKISAIFPRFLCNLLGAKNSHHIAIDINSSNVRILELSKQKNHYRIENIVCDPIPSQNNQGSDEETIIQHLKNIIDNHGLKSRDAALAISHSGIMAKTITLPHQLKENELEEFLALNIEQHINLAADKISFDYRMVEIPKLETPKLGASTNTKSGGASTIIELIAARKENTEKCMALLEGVDLTAKVIDSDAHALSRVSNLLALDPTEIFAIINLEDEKILITIVKQNKCIYAQEYFIEHYTFRNTQTLAKQIYNNLQLSLATINQPISTIVLCGKHAKAEDLIEHLQNISKINTITANPFCDMDIANHLDKLETMEKAPAMTLCCGLALWERHDFNLLPWRQLLHTKKQKNRKQLLYLSITLGFLITAIWHFTLTQKISSATAIQHELLPQITALEQQENQITMTANEIAAAKTRLDAIKSLQSNQVETVALLTNLSHITPPAISLFNLQKNNTAIIINGSTTNLSSITEFMQRITKINSLMQPKIQEIKNISEQEHIFTITTNLKSAN